MRANTLRTTRDRLAQELERAGVQTDPARFAPQGLIVKSGNPLLAQLAHTGAFFVQDETSQLVGEFVAASPGERIPRRLRIARREDDADGGGDG